MAREPLSLFLITSASDDSAGRWSADPFDVRVSVRSVEREPDSSGAHSSRQSRTRLRGVRPLTNPVLTRCFRCHAALGDFSAVGGFFACAS
jgi:hypothetical protein